MPDVNPRLLRLAAYPAEALRARREALAARGLRVLDFSVGDPVEPTDRRIVRALRDGVPAVSQYPAVVGLPAFRAAAASYLYRRFGVSVDPDRQILPTSGAKEAIFHLPFAFLDPAGPRRRVLFGVPGYPAYARGAIFAGGEPWPVLLEPARGYRLEPWALPERALAQTAIVWVNYPHNPTGATVDRGYLRDLAAFCRERDILLCSDECYADLYFAEPPPSILEVATRGVLAFHSMSKRSGMTGYRSGFVAGDPALVDVLRRARANFGVAQPEPTQRAAIAALRDDAHAARRREVFRRKRDILTAFFREAGIAHAPCRATLYLWVRVPGREDAAAYADRLADAGILTSPAPQLGADLPYLRLALVPDEAGCREAVRRWRALAVG